MSARVLLSVPLLVALSACTDGANDPDMMDDEIRDDEMLGDDDETQMDDNDPVDAQLNAVLQAREDSITDPVFAFVTPAAQTLTGSATYSGAAAIETAPNGRDSDVSFIAYGLMDAQVSFERGRIAAQASDFLQLDATAYNATGAEE